MPPDPVSPPDPTLMPPLPEPVPREVEASPAPPAEQPARNPTAARERASDVIGEGLFGIKAPVAMVPEFISGKTDVRTPRQMSLVMREIGTSITATGHKSTWYVS